VRFVFAGVLLFCATAQAGGLTVVVMDAQSLSEPNVRKVHKVAVEVLSGLTAMPVSDAYLKPKKPCSPTDLACQREQAGPAAVGLWLLGSKDTVIVDAVLWLDGERVSAPKNGDASLDALDFGLKPVLDSVLPGWLKRGWGALALNEGPPKGSVLKLDGRVLSPGAPPRGVLPVTAGEHQLDVLLPDGRAELQRITVPEASRTRVDMTVAAPEEGSSRSSVSGLRMISYIAWMVGTAFVLTAFVSGFISRSTGSGQNPCRPDSRGCVTLDEAIEQARLAKLYASTANVLLGTGLAFSLAGAGLFTIDVLR
jgi:hypothetical protein